MTTLSKRRCAGILPLVALLSMFFAARALAAESDGAKPSTVRLMLALIWEGRHLEAHNIDALRRFRAEFSDLQVVHFISPAYFLKSDMSPTEARERIRQVVRPGDRIGLSLAAWKSLTTRAGIIFREGPTFWGNVTRPLDCMKDCGADVPIHVYPEGDMIKLLDTALAVLEEQGLGRMLALQTTGWVASPELLEAAAKAGVRYDFSAVAAELIWQRAAQYPLYGWVKGLWPAVTPHTQPHVLPTRTGSLTEIPQSTAAIDYLTVGEVDALFKEYAELARRDTDRELTFPLTFYQETAHTSLPRLTRALQSVFDTASRQGVALAPLDLSDLPDVQGIPALKPSELAPVPVAH